MFKHTLTLGTMLASLPMLATAQPLLGPYVSLGAGVNLQQNEIVTAAPSVNFPNDVIYTFHPGFAGKASVGYGLGHGLRVEIEGDYISNVVRGAQGASSEPGLISRYGSNPSRRGGGLERKYGGFVNVLYDVSLGLPFTPYVGVGAGSLAVEHNHFNQNIEAARVVPPTPIPGAPPFGFHDQTVAGFAYQGIAGAAIAIPWVPGLSFTAEYHFAGLLDPLPAFQLEQSRYVLAGPTCIPGQACTLNRYYKHIEVQIDRHFTNDFNHEAILGFRYALFQPPVPLPPAAPPAPVASVVQGESPNYLVFFDWDRANLSDRGRQIIARAAEASHHGVTRIQVDGYTDLSGTAAYNQRLSLRRASSVKDELVRDGVSASEISVQGHGESNPLVATAPGLREPQNRRVQIVLR